MMNLEIFVDGQWTLKGSYPTGCKPAVQTHVYDAMENCAKSWTDGGYRVRIDGREIGVVSAERMAATQLMMEIVTTPRPPYAYQSFDDAALCAAKGM